jgi:hypothetical protein
MEAIVAILSAASTAVNSLSSAATVTRWLVGYLRRRACEQKSADVLRWMHDLGCTTAEDVRRVVAEWDPGVDVTPEVRAEFEALLTNLVRGARFHTTNGSPRSAFLRCERLVEQLVSKLQPRRRKGEPVGANCKEWKLERFLGMGSFGEAWSARHAYFPKRRAVKFFTTDGGRDWLKREAVALFQIKEKLGDHPNVVGYEDVSLDDEPFPFLVLELVEGGSLEEWILTPPGERRPLDSVDLMAAVARGLSQAHRHGVSHRDVKPANVLLTDEEEAAPKLTDFGLSKADAVPEGRGSSLATQGAVVGTNMYLPPEAANPYEERDHRQDDVFAFGVTWFQVLVGRIERPSYDFADRLREAGVDSRTIQTLARCLARPDRRFESAVELSGAFDDGVGLDHWEVPKDCFDVGGLAAEYLAAARR